KRLITGESLFCTVFTNLVPGKKRVAFAAPYPGKIIPLDLKNYNGTIICQKDAFLCAAKGVSIGVHFQKRIGVALFGGEGFIMQKLEGDGLAFVHAGGTIIEKELNYGESLRVDTGCLVALTKSVNYDIQTVSGIKSGIFGGEGFFFAHLTGPGHVWLQSLPFSRLAGKIHQAAPQTCTQSLGEGSVIGGLGKLFQD
ncbi:MAG: AIM24 family protein, partial [Desulfobacterales bacterium]